MPVNNLDDVHSTTDRVVAGPGGDIPVRIYQPHGEPSKDRAAIVFYHGGGFVFCDIESHDGFCRAMARAAKPSSSRSTTAWPPNIPPRRRRSTRSRRSAG